MNKQIPASNWVLSKEYFEVELVVDFELKYRDWFTGEGNIINQDFERFMLYLKENPTVELYQFPQARTDIEHDYFERDDDNHVVPRHLFTPI